MAHDTGIVEAALDVLRPETGHRLDIEIGEGGTEILALPEDRQPGEPRLEALQAELLEKAAVVGDGPAPFLVVIAEIERIFARPPAALAAVRLL